MATQRVSNIFEYSAVELVFATIPDQELELSIPLEIDLNDYLPEGLIYTFGIKSGTELPPNFAINTMTGIVMGTPMTAFTQDYNPVFTATVDSVTAESNAVAFILESNALWTNAAGMPLWVNQNSVPLWTRR